MDELDTSIEAIQTGDGDELSWPEMRHDALVLFTILVVAPAGLMIGLAVAFFLLPVLIVLVPFILPGTVAEGAAEHEHRLEHDALEPLPSHAH